MIGNNNKTPGMPTNSAHEPHIAESERETQSFPGVDTKPTTIFQLIQQEISQISVPELAELADAKLREVLIQMLSEVSSIRSKINRRISNEKAKPKNEKLIQYLKEKTSTREQAKK